jgi:hypothetical protein
MEHLCIFSLYSIVKVQNLGLGDCRRRGSVPIVQRVKTAVDGMCCRTGTYSGSSARILSKSAGGAVQSFVGGYRHFVCTESTPSRAKWHFALQPLRPRRARSLPGRCRRAIGGLIKRFWRGYIGAV